MTIATDYAAYGASTQRKEVVNAATKIGGASGILAEVIPDAATHLSIIPEETEIHIGIGEDASTASPVLPAGGITLNAEVTALDEVSLYAIATTNVGFVIGGASLKTVNAGGSAPPYSRLLDVWRGAVDNTANGRSLETMKGSALSSLLREVCIVPEDSSLTVTFEDGNASATSARWPATGASLPVTKALADELQFFYNSATSTYVAVMEMA